MHYIFIILKLILFIASNLGIWEFFRRKTKMDIFFLPAFTVCLQITVLFCAGILNVLPLAVVGMYGMGIILAAFYLYTDFKNVIHTYKNAGYAFLAVAVCLLLIACKGHIFTEYDNFSHWALVVKSMLLTNRFPSFEDALVAFKEYPLGSASFIYYVCKLVSTSEPIQMFAQGFMLLCFILPVFKLLKRHVIAGSIYILLFVNYLFCYNIPIIDLPVDSLLPLQGMAMLLFIYMECTNLAGWENTPGGGICTMGNSVFMRVCPN